MLVSNTSTAHLAALMSHQTTSEPRQEGLTPVCLSSSILALLCPLCCHWSGVRSSSMPHPNFSLASCFSRKSD